MDIGAIAVHNEKLEELGATNQIGLETVKEFWFVIAQPDIFFISDPLPGAIQTSGWVSKHGGSVYLVNQSG